MLSLLLLLTPFPMQEAVLGNASPWDEGRRACASSAEEFGSAAPLRRGLDGSPFTFLTSATPKLTFYPQGGLLWRDTQSFGYVDLDPSPRILEWDCNLLTYNGHTGWDLGLRGFQEQRIGVPVFAAMDGVVVLARDGYFDEHTGTSGCGSLDNMVCIDHGNGRTTWYHHLKNGSVAPAVFVGRVVRAGEQIGLTGSSGCSSGPHLHFEVLDGTRAWRPSPGPATSPRANGRSSPYPFARPTSPTSTWVAT